MQIGSNQNPCYQWFLIEEAYITISNINACFMYTLTLSSAKILFIIKSTIYIYIYVCVCVCIFLVKY